VKRGEKLVVIGREEGEGDGVDGKLGLVRARFEDVPGGVPTGSALLSLVVSGAKYGCCGVEVCPE